MKRAVLKVLDVFNHYCLYELDFDVDVFNLLYLTSFVLELRNSTLRLAHFLYNCFL